jgi:hypothetical protein
MNVQKPKKRSFCQKAGILFLIILAVAFIFAIAILLNNNVSLTSDAAFEKKLNAALEKAIQWTVEHESEIIEKKNMALIKILNEINKVKPEPTFERIVSAIMDSNLRPRCWKALIDPNWHVDDIELNIAIKNQYLDNQWVLYSLAPDIAKFDPNKAGLFEPDKWQDRKLTHQLDALLKLKQTKPETGNLDELIDHLCDRLADQLVFDVALIDLYIQKVTFILRAEQPQRIKHRWVERIINNQMADGGWNDKWLFSTSKTRKPVLNFSKPPTDQHATVQGLTTLYLIKYKYPKHFGLE